MRTILITGANRGLGLALATVALQRGERVWASCRDPGAATELYHLRAQFPANLEVVTLDICDAESRRSLRRRIEAAEEWFDVVIHNAAIYVRSPEVEPEISHRSIHAVQTDTMLRMFEVNAACPIALTRELLARVRRDHGATIAFLSSGMASLARKDASEIEYSYSASKAALNMMVRVLALELLSEGITTVALNPGWVATDMGTAAAPLDPQDVATALLDVIDRLEADDSGGFLDYRGNTVPW